jgi:predicted NUDIX family phosphoesterase
MNKMDEQIIVVSREKLFESEKLAFQGTLTNPDTIGKIMENVENNFEIMRRGDAEENPAYKQPIPYVVIKKGSHVFLYKRLSQSGESRLVDKFSIGVGGHMNDIEGASKKAETLKVRDFSVILTHNFMRELSEELDITGEFDISAIGLINDDVEEVGKVHIGVLVVAELEADGNATVRETDVLDGGWIDLNELASSEYYDKLETWSRFSIDLLVGK